MKVLLNIIFSTFGALGNLTLVLLIVIYIFAVMGMQVIGGEYNPGAFDAVLDQTKFPRLAWAKALRLRLCVQQGVDDDY